MLEDAAVPGIVIDAGSAWTRVGLPGELTPRVSQPSVVADIDGEFRYGAEAVRYSGSTTEIRTPLVDGVVHDFDAAAGLWNALTHQILGTDLSEQPLTLTENQWNPSTCRQKLVETAFETLNVPLFQLVKTPVCAALQTAQATALVVQVGAATTSAVPVVDGKPITKAAVYTRFAGDFVTAHAESQLHRLGVDVVPEFMVNGAREIRTDRPATSSFHAFQASRVLDQFKQVVCLASPRPLTGPEIKGVRSFEFPNGVTQLLGSERLTITEPLFKPSATPLPGTDNKMLPSTAMGLAELVYQACQKADAPPEVSIHLTSNIVLCGGTSQIPGLQQRLEFSLQEMMPNYVLRFADVGDRSTVVWTGASVLASLPTWDQALWITKAQYDEKGAQGLIARNVSSNLNEK